LLGIFRLRKDNGAMRICRIAIFALVFSTPSFGEDWEAIALGTDEPSVGIRIEEVEPGSTAENLRLKPGDFIHQIGEQRIRGFGKKDPKQEEVLFFVRKGGFTETAVVPAGKIGFRSSYVFMPWLDYYRGEIGSQDTGWDTEVVAALESMHDDPDLAGQWWKDARAKGYPEDELDAFVNAYLGWRRGEVIPVQETFDKVFEEFEVLPAVYATRLEDFAFFSHRTALLRQLRELDPDSSLVSQAYLEAWNLMEVQDPAPINLLRVATDLRGDDQIDRVSAPSDVKRDYLPQLLDKKGLGAPPGHFNNPSMLLPADLEDFHFSMTFSAHCTGYDERWGSLIRVVLSDRDRDSSSIPVGKTLVDVGLGDSQFIGPHVAIKGGHVRDTRAFHEPMLNLPLVIKGQGVVREPLNGAYPRHRIDIVKVEDEIAAYVNGICYLHLPVDAQPKGMALTVHICGMAMKAEKIHLWNLKP